MCMNRTTNLELIGAGLGNKNNCNCSALQQDLDNFEEVNKYKVLLRAIVKCLVQELLDIEFTEFMAAEPHELMEERK